MIASRRSTLRVQPLEDRTVPTAGGLDFNFDDDGLAYVRTGPFQADHALDVLLQPDGKVVLAGNSSSFTGDGSPLLARLNEDGSLDNSFAGDGTVLLTVPNATGGFNAVARQKDGKLIAAGAVTIDGHPHFLLARYHASGVLDGAFGTGGYVIDPVPGYYIHDVAIQPDGKIVVAGNLFRVQRYTAGGRLDTTFSGDGNASVDLGPTDPEARAVLIQSDGKIVLAGSSSSSGGNFSFVVVRFNPGGTLDSTFDTDGIVSTSPPDTAFQSANDIVQLPDGKLLAAGTVGLGSGYTKTPTLLRYHPNGQLDSSFGTDGYAITYLGNYAGLEGVAVQPDGKIVAAGYGAVGGPTGYQSILLRYRPNGTLDDSFGPAGQTVMPGVVWTDLAPNDNDGFAAVALTGDGRIVAAGTAGGGTARSVGVARYFAEPLVAIADEFSTPEDTSIHVDAPGLMDNDGRTGTPQVTLVNGPAHAAYFQLNPDGSFDYTPDPNFHGTDSFTYRLVDGTNTSRPATVTLTVSSVNDPPTAAADDYHIPLGDLIVPASRGLLANDSDVDNDVLTASLVDAPATGTVDVRPDGSFTFSGFPPDFFGTITFTYQVSDGTVTGPPTTVTLRRHLSVIGGVLKIIGTSGPDVIQVRPADLQNFVVVLTTPDRTIRERVARRLFPGGIDVQPGDGDDRLVLSTGFLPITVVGAAGNDSIRTGAGSDTIFGDDEASTGTGNDVIVAGGGRNRVAAAGGDNVIRTGAGADIITTGLGSQDIVSGGGDDAITVGSGGSEVRSGAGSDSVLVTGGSNLVLGGPGNDILIGGTDADQIFGNDGKDLLVGGTGADNLFGGLGHDLLFDGTVEVTSPATDSLARILADYSPTNRSSLVDISGRLSVTFDPTGLDQLLGGLGLDWFWTQDDIDQTDRRATEPLNFIT